MTDNFNFKKKAIMRHKNHVILNEGSHSVQQQGGNNPQVTVSHLEKKGDEFVELKRNEAALKHASKKVLRKLDMKTRDKIKVPESGLGKTPDWFQEVAATVDWEASDIFIYELEHLWMAMFFVRELHGDKKTGREQILRLTEEDEDLGLQVMAELHYESYSWDEEIDMEKSDGILELAVDDQNGISTDLSHTLDIGEHGAAITGIREMLTGVALKHGYKDEQLIFTVEKNGDRYFVDVLNKDFKLLFSTEGNGLKSGISSWVIEMFWSDGCPLNPDTIEVEQ